MMIEPPPVERLAWEPAGPVIVSGTPAPVLLNSDTVPPEVTTEELAPKFWKGAINLNALPPLTVKVVPAARLIEPVGSLLRTLSFLRSTSPVAPALNV